MQERALSSSPCPDHPVWAALQDYRIGPDDAALGFVDRLARDNGWSAGHAARVVDEYRRFVFLAVTGDAAVTPSDAVDQAWHLHLTYSRDYWEGFCPVLGRPLHHGPTAGGAAEATRYYHQYAETLARYEAVFGITPPADIWPDAARRLHRDPRARRVDPAHYLIIPRRRLWQGLALLVVVLLLWGGLR